MNDTSLLFEVDPNKQSNQGQADSNAKQLENLIRKLLDSIFQNESMIPLSVRIIFSKISKISEQKFPGHGRLAVGGLIFLRLICPAIISPEQSGIVESSSQIDKNYRRGLLLSTKIMQNLANNVLFGNKEEFMVRFNDILNEYRAPFDIFLDNLSVNTDVPDDQASISNYTDGDCIIGNAYLHFYIVENLPKLESIPLYKVAEFFVPTNQSAPKSFEKNFVQYLWKEQLEKIHLIMNSLGPAPNVDAVKKKYSDKYSGRKASSAIPNISNVLAEASRNLKKKKVLYVAKECVDRTPVFYYNSGHVNLLQIDPNSLLYLLIEELQPFFKDEISIFVDLTLFDQQCEWPKTMMNYLEKLLAPDSRSKIKRIIFFNPNYYFKSVCKGFTRFIYGKHKIQTETVNTLEDIYNFISEDKLVLHPETAALMKAKWSIYPNVLLISKKKETAVTLSITTGYIQLIYNRKQEIFGNQAIITDYFPLISVQDLGALKQNDDKKLPELYLIINNPEPIRMVFVTSQRDNIIKELQCELSLARLAKVKVISEDRSVKLQELPGTLLNIAFANLCSTHGALRLAGYALLKSIKNRRERNNDASDNAKLLRGPVIPRNSEGYILKLSREMAAAEKELSFEFLMEFFNGYNKYSEKVKYLSLVYMIPWLENILELDPVNSDKPNLICSQLAKIFLSDHHLEINIFSQSNLWNILRHQQQLISVLLPVLVDKSSTFALDSPQVDSICSIVLSMIATESVGEEILKYIKFVFDETLKGTDIVRLTDSKNWKKICILMRLIAHISFEDRLNSKKNMAILCYFWIITSGLGSPLKRRTITCSILNVVYCLMDIPTSKRSAVVTAMKLSDYKYHSLFGFESAANADFELTKFALSATDADLLQDSKYEEASISEIDHFCSIIWDLINFGAPNPGMLFLTRHWCHLEKRIR
jgi:neurofibromin 1